MAKGVLGNDPFQRGAASRDGGSAKPGDGTKEASAGDAKPARKEAARKSAPPAKQPARAKAGGGKTSSAPGKKSAAAKAGGASGGSRDSHAAGDAKVPETAKAGGRKSAASREADEARKSEVAKAGGHKTPAAGGAGPAEAPGRKQGTRAAERKHEAEAAPPHAEQPAALTDDEAALPLREPAAPVSPHSPPPPRQPVLSDELGARTPQQREVDHALAEALAAEVAEATAKVAVDEAMERRPGEEQDVDRLMATEMATEMAEAAVEEVLEHSPSTQHPERERELAAAVAAQVAEAAAEVAVAEVLDRHAVSRRQAFPEEGDEGLEERAANAGEGEEEGFQDTFDLEAEAEGGFGPGEDDEEVPFQDTSGLELSVTLSVTEQGTRETSSLEAEVEAPDATRDEFPPGRRGPLSLVPPPDEGERPREPFFTDQVREPEGPRPLAQRAAGMLSLARDIAGQALASEGLGRALGAMNGLMEAVRAGLGTGGGANIDEYGKDPALVEHLEPVLEFLYSQYWRVSVQGADHVPQGAAILVANHSGALPYDGLVMSLVLSRERPDLREPRWLVEDQVFHAPVLGTLFNRLGAVRACPENALRLLDEQRPLVVFPEGYQALSKPFAERYRLKRFGRGGFVKLALRTGAPIVPVAIVGGEETSPLLGRLPASFLGLPYLPLTPLGPLPLPAKWSVRFGEPIGMEGLPPEAADDLGEVQRLTERTRESIQGMVQSLLRERRSVFAG
ncbi:lysophospholipid acyltransferase family protein [Myxococcus sp. RHSTA-1-4]|uniref:lysophospholipid acyltransferase family protein n=1 Tax=Myxococcus sp. RHSTA-1-4 TaxID=2874601 RepID=UPI001CBC603E|nr:lysophospholipid acyltransferase family protein [Myxococcus sp. RHSTA-1-4]MBZ4419919.1 acyltransferase family protein [Myxococcus sp. RHSTA-1-4]